MSAESVSPNSLSEQFSRLTSEGESANVPLRRALLENLVEVLSPWDFIHLRTLLRNKKPGLADFCDLPNEVVALVTSQLSCKDVFACAAVSRAWRQACTRDVVVTDLVKVYFPDYEDIITQSIIPKEAAVSSGPYLWRALAVVAAQNLTRMEGNYISHLKVSIEPATIVKDRFYAKTKSFKKYKQLMSGPDAREAHKKLQQQQSHEENDCYAYSSGRVAFNGDAYSFFIDDLNTRNRIYVTLPDAVLKGQKDFVVYQMTDRLVILLDGATRRALIVYNLQNRQFRRVTLPNRMMEMYVDKETIAMTFPPPALPHVWRWRGGLIKLPDPTPHGIKHKFHNMDGLPPWCGFIFHHSDPEVLYFVSNCPSGPFSKPKKKFSVSPGEFQNSDDEIQLYIQRMKEEDDYDDIHDDEDEHTTGHQIAVHKFENFKYTKSFRRYTKFPLYNQFLNRCRKMNSYGLYNLAVSISDRFLIFETPPYVLGHINFDTRNEVFSVRRQIITGQMRMHDFQSPEDLPRRVDEIQGGIVWNNQVYHLQDVEVDERQETETRWPEVLAGENAICVSDQSSTLVMAHEKKFKFKGGIRHLGVDDDFVVALSKHEYVAWNFRNWQQASKPWIPNKGTSRLWLRIPAIQRECPHFNEETEEDENAIECDGPERPEACFACEEVFRKEYLHGLVHGKRRRRRTRDYRSDDESEIGGYGWYDYDDFSDEYDDDDDEY
ncbi:hypothetical protein CkaCkLH20_03585 [Colletotrichum karsti]|uniref:F-box domain-containing protein n=1 Tax=Colletotrichum karsti TaxID=1095194 RepID=A0A9P6LMQ3_9PEZI|nr:uncharacterized protein CkaCkLH20_03585 [Colletotrichum karsti]KAF9878685.1 hypothetical protein CkaCkLH20_03585 [Colletotrichum karsti]